VAGDADHEGGGAGVPGVDDAPQHQIVYQSLQGQMGGVLHALALQTGVPES